MSAKSPNDAATSNSKFSSSPSSLIGSTMTKIVKLLGHKVN